MTEWDTESTRDAASVNIILYLAFALTLLVAASFASNSIGCCRMYYYNINSNNNHHTAYSKAIAAANRVKLGGANTVDN